MKFFDIQNTREFFERVVTCAGEIYEVEVGGQERDLKGMAESMLISGMADRMQGIREINLKIENGADMDRLLHYAMAMGRERICA